MMELFKITPADSNGESLTPEDNSNRMDVMEAKLNLLITITGGQFVGFLGLIITLILSLN